MLEVLAAFRAYPQSLPVTTSVGRSAGLTELRDSGASETFEHGSFGRICAIRGTMQSMSAWRLVSVLTWVQGRCPAAFTYPRPS